VDARDQLRERSATRLKLACVGVGEELESVVVLALDGQVGASITASIDGPKGA
jgi:hypothetical protein